MKNFLAIAILALCSVAAFAQSPSQLVQQQQNHLTPAPATPTYTISNPNSTFNYCITSRVSNAHRTYINSCKFLVNVELLYTDGQLIERYIPANNPVEDTRMGDVKWFTCKAPTHAFSANMAGKLIPISPTTTAYQCYATH